MGNSKKEEVDAKWDACADLTLRRFLYSSLAGAFGGLLFFRSPTSRWASVAFGGGVGIGSAYSHCSRLFNGGDRDASLSPSPSPSPSPTNLPPPPPPPHVSHVLPIQNVQDPE